MRHILCQDALKWLDQQDTIPNVVTGICDLDETPHPKNMDKYLDFFTQVATQIFERLDPKCYAIFIQTDRKYQREWIDKSHILTGLAYQHDLKLIWHKIVLHREVDKTDLYRPTYAHMLCYGHSKATTGAATPDVLPPSKRLYKNGTPILACERAIEFIKRYSKVPAVVDPFVGQGTVIAVAEHLGLQALGIDIDPKQCQKAEQLKYP